MGKRRKAKIVETVLEQVLEETKVVPVIEVDVAPVTVASEPQIAPVVVESLKSQVLKLIDEAPLLIEVQGNPWKYTEWLAILNGLVLRA